MFALLSVIAVSNGLVQARHWLQPQATGEALGSRFAEAATGESRSGSDRLHYLVSAGDMWWAHPLTGVGAGAYGDVHPQYQRQVVSASTSAHNFYVQTLAELGLVGVMLLAWLLLVLLIGGLRGLLQRPGWWWAVPWILGTSALVLHSGLDIDARYPAILFLVAAMLGAMYTQVRERRAPLSWSLAVWALAVLMAAASWYTADSWAQRARAAQGEGDFSLAATELHRANASFMANPDWLSAEGINLYTLAAGKPEGSAARCGLADQALSRARAAQAADPADAQHYQLEGRIRQLLGDKAGAETAFRRTLQLDPLNHPDYATDLASLQWRRGQAAQALATARPMLDRYSDDVLANRNNDETLRPVVANLWALVGNIELQQNRRVEARQAAQRALTINPGNLRGRALAHQLDLRL